MSAAAMSPRLARAREFRALGEALLYLAPSLVIFLAFIFVPLARGVYLSLYYTNPIGNPTTFAGLDQYRDLLSSSDFRATLVATFLFTLYSVPTSILLGLVLAVLANQQLRGINVFRTLMSSSIGVSAAVGALIWFLMFNPSLGLLNYLFSLLHLPGSDWLTDPNRAILAVSITTLWLLLGFNIIVLLAGLQGISQELYESARIDGAIGLRLFRSITVPLLSPSLFFLLVFDTATVCQAFTQIHLLTRGGPVDTTRTLVYAVYRDGFINFQFGYAQTEAFVLFLVIVALTFVQFRFVERRVHYQ